MTSLRGARAAAAAADTRPLWRVFLAFVAPMVLGNVLQALSGTFNSVFVGQLLGTRALAAVAAVAPLMFFFVALIIGVGAGASVLIGQAWGAGELPKVKAIAGTALTVGLGIGAAVALLGGAFAEAVLVWLQTPPDVLAEAVAYARMMMFAMPGLLVFILMTQLMRGVGDTVTPLFALVLSIAVSAGLTPALLRGWAGLPAWGVTGAAAASIVSFVVALLYLAWHMRRHGHPLAPDRALLRALRIDRRILALVTRIGLPTGVQVIVMSLAEVVLLSLVNRFGSDATAAFGAVAQVVNYVQFPALSISITASILSAQAIGAGRTERLGAILRTGLAMNLAITGGLVLLGYLFSRHLMGWFITSAPVIELAQALLHLMLWSTLLFGVQALLAGVMRASGTVLLPTAISILCIVFIEVPSAYVLSARFGVQGVWLAYPVTFVSMLLLQGAYYQLVWRHRRIERLV